MRTRLYIEADSYEGFASDVDNSDMEGLLEETGILENSIVALEFLYVYCPGERAGSPYAVYEAMIYDKDEYAFYITKIFGNDKGFDYSGTVEHTFDEDLDEEGEDGAIEKYREIIEAEKLSQD